MTYQDFVARIIGDGERAATRDYADNAPKLAGARDGFAACRTCGSPPELALLLAFARDQVQAQLRAPLLDAEAHTHASAFAAEIEWVCNCVSALLLNEGHQPICPPTARGVLKCAELLGVAPGGQPLDPQAFLDSPAAGTPDCLCSFCGRPIDADEAIVLRALNTLNLEIRSCKRDACTRRFLSGQYGEPAPGRPS